MGDSRVSLDPVSNGIFLATRFFAVGKEDVVCQPAFIELTFDLGDLFTD